MFVLRWQKSQFSHGHGFRRYDQRTREGTRLKQPRADLLKSAYLDSGDQSEAVDALTGACCANANTTKDCVTLWFAVSYELLQAARPTGGTSPSSERPFFNDRYVPRTAFRQLRHIYINWLTFEAWFALRSNAPKLASSVLSTCWCHLDCSPKVMLSKETLQCSVSLHVGKGILRLFNTLHLFLKCIFIICDIREAATGWTWKSSHPQWGKVNHEAQTDQ